MKTKEQKMYNLLTGSKDPRYLIDFIALANLGNFMNLNITLLQSILLMENNVVFIVKHIVGEQPVVKF